MPTYGPLVRRAARWGGALFVLGSVQFLLGMVLTQAYYSGGSLFSGYSLSQNYVSDLGGPRSHAAWIFNDSIRLLGLLGIVGALAIRSAFPSRTTARLGLGFLLIASVGAILVGTYTESAPQLGGNIHSVVSLVTFLGSAFALLFLGLGMFRDTRWEGFRGYTFLSGAVTLIALLLFIDGSYVGLGPGGMERLVIAPILLWAILAGQHLARMKTFAPPVAVVTTC